MNEGAGARVFALTGGIGSGKSSVATIWRDLGVAIVDADELSRDVVKPGMPALEKIKEAFGSEILLHDGSLDRNKLGALVFNDEALREKLNAIVHPEVRRAAEAQFSKFSGEGYDLICYVIPLLFETKQEDKFRPVVVVTATQLEQMERVAKRDGLAPQEAAARLRAQMPLREKEVRADVVIVNSSTQKDLKERAKAALLAVRDAIRGA